MYALVRHYGDHIGYYEFDIIAVSKDRDTLENMLAKNRITDSVNTYEVLVVTLV